MIVAISVSILKMLARILLNIIITIESNVEDIMVNSTVKRASYDENILSTYLKEINAIPLLTREEADHLVVLDEALERLEAASPRAAEVVRYRFFGGLGLEETATLLGVSGKTIQRDWLAARAWLRKEVARALDLPE